MKIKSFLYVSIVVFIVACSSFEYIEPTGPDIATIEVINKSPYRVQAMQSQIGDCTDMWPIGNNNQPIANEPRVGLVNPTDLYVVNIGFFGVGNINGQLASESCFFTKGFKVEAKKHYRITYATNSEGCVLDISEINDQGSNKVNTVEVEVHNKWGPQHCNVK